MNDSMVKKYITMKPFEFLHDVHRIGVRSLVHIDTYINLVAIEERTLDRIEQSLKRVWSIICDYTESNFGDIPICVSTVV